MLYSLDSAPLWTPPRLPLDEVGIMNGNERTLPSGSEDLHSSVNYLVSYTIGAFRHLDPRKSSQNQCRAASRSLVRSSFTEPRPMQINRSPHPSSEQ